MITLLQLSFYPSLKKTFNTFAFPVSFSASLLTFTIVSWYCGLFQFPIQIALIPFLALFAFHFYNHNYSIKDLKGEWRWGL
ncbi:MAG: hypothetical protein LUQ54_04280, partial [Methanoregula sp.]|nr:hypothetical protein [Methanoregula sp.]